MLVNRIFEWSRYATTWLFFFVAISSSNMAIADNDLEQGGFSTFSFDPGISNPNGLAFDSSTGRIFVHASFSSTIEIFDQTGAMLGSIPDPGANGYSSDYFFSSQTTNIGGVVVPPNSLLILEDYQNAGLLIAADPNTGAVIATQSLNFIGGEAVGGTYCESTGTFFAVDYVTDELYEFDGNNGALLNTYPVGMDIYYGDVEYNANDGNLYIVSSTDELVRVLDPTGNFVKQINFRGLTDYVSGIGIDQQTGDLWVGSVLDGVTKLETSVMPGFGALNGIAFDSSTNRIFVHADLGSTIEIFQKTGAYLGSIPDPGANGYSSDYFFSSKDTKIGGVNVPANSLLILDDHLGAGLLIAADPDTGAIIASQNLTFITGEAVGGTYCATTGTFFAIDYIMDEIYEFDGSDGALLNTFSVGADFDVYYGDIEFNPFDGNLYAVSSSQNLVRVFEPNGDIVEDIDLTGVTDYLSGLSFDSHTGEAFLSTARGDIARVIFNRYSVIADSVKITRGDYLAGDVASTRISDNDDLSIRRGAADVQSRTQFEIDAYSPFSVVSSMELTVEGSVFARSPVNQIVEIFDFSLNQWEVIDTREASRLMDRTDVVPMTENLARFIEPGTNRIQARVRFQSTSQRQKFTSNTDQVMLRLCR